MIRLIYSISFGVQTLISFLLKFPSYHEIVKNIRNPVAKIFYGLCVGIYSFMVCYVLLWVNELSVSELCWIHFGLMAPLVMTSLYSRICDWEEEFDSYNGIDQVAISYARRNENFRNEFINLYDRSLAEQMDLLSFLGALNDQLYESGFNPFEMSPFESSDESENDNEEGEGDLNFEDIGQPQALNDFVRIPQRRNRRQNGGFRVFGHDIGGGHNDAIELDHFLDEFINQEFIDQAGNNLELFGELQQIVLRNRRRLAEIQNMFN